MRTYWGGETFIILSALTPRILGVMLACRAPLKVRKRDNRPMLRRDLQRLAAAGLLILCSIGTSPVSAIQKAVSASDAWIKLPAAGDTTTTAFAVIDNPTMYDVYLVSASSEVAAEIGFVDASPAGKDTAVKEIPAPAYGKVELTPTGVHFVLKGLKRPLTAGQTIAITVVTDGGVAIVLSANVRTQ